MLIILFMFIQLSYVVYYIAGLCKLRCFPPVALAWDATSGLHVIPNLFTETILVDSSPALLGSTPETDKTTVLLLVCSLSNYFFVHTIGISYLWLSVLASSNLKKW